MVHLISSVIATSAILASVAPGALAAPARPLPLREGSHSGLMKSATAAVKRDHLKISKDYDPNHSQHWNYHYGYVNEDGHGHGWPKDHSRRAFRSEAEHLLDVDIDAQVLKMKRSEWINKANAIEKTGALLDADVAGIEIHLKRRDGKLGMVKRDPRSGHKHKHKHGHSHEHEHIHAHSHSHKRDTIELEPRSHDHEHKHKHEHEHVHEHIHEHSHKRDLVELDRRSKSAPKRFERASKKGAKPKGGKKKGSSKKASSKKTSGGSKKASSGKAKSAATEDEDTGAINAGVKVSLGREKRAVVERGLATAGVPGFVEVATQLFNSTLARTIAGLVFTTNPDSTGNSSFILGTSDSQSTQFYLTTAENPDPLTPAELNVVNIRVPILDSQKLVTTDYCASFDLTPPSPLELLPCGDNVDFSQNFAYNGVTGELQPLYAASPAPMALVTTSGPSNSSSTNSTQSLDSPATNGTESASQPKSFAADTAAADDDEDREPEMTDIGLYFVPASAYYDAPKLVNSLMQQADNSTATPSADPSGLLPANSTASATPTSTSATSTVTATSEATSARASSTSSSEAPSSTPTSASSSSSPASSSSSASSSASGTPVPTVRAATMNALAEPTATSSDSASATPSSTPESSSTSASTSASSTETPLSTVTLSASSTPTPTATSSSALEPSSAAPSSSASTAASSIESGSATPSATPTVTLSPADEKVAAQQEKMVRRARRFARW
ncbi:hypothetical protein JCM10207_002665 [Rhodosporidiobolus poonsookiae]